MQSYLLGRVTTEADELELNWINEKKSVPRAIGAPSSTLIPTCDSASNTSYATGELVNALKGFWGFDKLTKALDYFANDGESSLKSLPALCVGWLLAK